MRDLRLTLVYFLIFTIISSAIAYSLVVKAYSNAYDDQDNYSSYLSK
jgi:hypothetical protein